MLALVLHDPSYGSSWRLLGRSANSWTDWPST
jgi:hypothetical protein